jgi:hypothetical protein
MNLVPTASEKNMHTRLIMQNLSLEKISNVAVGHQVQTLLGATLFTQNAFLTSLRGINLLLKMF